MKIERGLIKDFLGLPRKEHKNATDEFLKLAGSWQDKRDADEIIRDIPRTRSIKRYKDLF